MACPQSSRRATGAPPVRPRRPRGFIWCLSPTSERTEAMTDLLPGFESRRVPAMGIEIACRIAGNGPPLLMLHGYPQTHVCWHRLAPALAKSFTVVLPDLPGYGDSGFLEPDP